MKLYNTIGVFTGLLVVAVLSAATGTALADTDSFAEEQFGTKAVIGAGYRSISVHGEPNRAAEYQSLQSSPTFKGKIFSAQEGYHLDMDLNYLNDDEFSSEAHLETGGLFRLDVRSDRFVHNLDHIPYANGLQGHPPTRTTPRIAPGPFVEGSRPDVLFPYRNSTGSNRARQIYYNDQNSNENYELRLDFNEVKTKVKCPDYPAHLTLGYWRYDKEGEKQQRFLDHADRANDNNCAGCHMQSKTRDINLVTEEVKVGADAHVGFVDMVVEALYRKFSDQGATPRDNFAFPATGTYAHDEYPDSTLKELTLKLNTAPSGGLVGSTSFTLGKRENESSLDAESPVEAETDYLKATADVTYTPSQHWTLSLRYRLLDMDSDNTSTQYLRANTGAVTGPILVRDNMDITRNWYEGLVNYRPWQWLTLKGEVRFEEIDRSDTGDTLNDWTLPENEEIARIKLGFNSRFLPKSALKVNGWVALQHDDNPAYGTTPEDSTEFYLAGTYTPTASVGVTTSLNLLHESRNDRDVVQETTTYADLERKRDQQNFMLGSWVVLTEGLSLDVNYGYIRTKINQDLLFGTDPGSTPSTDYTTRDNDVDYDQTVQTVSVGTTWQALENISCRLEGYHIRSKGSYDPEFYRTGINYNDSGAPSNSIISSADLYDISKVDIAQNGLKGRVDWQIDENLTCGVEATFDDYDEKGNDVYDGSVQSYMASLTYTF